MFSTALVALDLAPAEHLRSRCVMPVVSVRASGIPDDEILKAASR